MRQSPSSSSALPGNLNTSHCPSPLPTAPHPPARNSPCLASTFSPAPNSATSRTPLVTNTKTIFLLGIYDGNCVLDAHTLRYGHQEAPTSPPLQSSLDAGRSHVSYEDVYKLLYLVSPETMCRKMTGRKWVYVREVLDRDGEIVRVSVTFISKEFKRSWSVV